MKCSYLFILFTAALSINCQTFAQKGIKGLVNAEKAFAAYTESHTIREGFLQYMDSAGLVFRQGNAVNAIETYQKQKPGPAILSWWPSFALISSSGDIGLTTGPYELRSGSLQDTPVARGSFASVWKINKKGIWKNVADLGISYNKVNPPIQQVKEMVLDKQKGKTNSGLAEVFQLDKKLNKAISEKNVSDISLYLSRESWLNLEGEQPLIGNQQAIAGLLKIPVSISLDTVSGDISRESDFAYVYGTISNGNKKENYLRVWILRNKRWQVILQTIKW
jgi:hypothetical protein